VEDYAKVVAELVWTEAELEKRTAERDRLRATLDYARLVLNRALDVSPNTGDTPDPDPRT
jgi:hypothetical protein